MVRGRVVVVVLRWSKYGMNVAGEGCRPATGLRLVACPTFSDKVPRTGAGVYRVFSTGCTGCSHRVQSLHITGVYNMQRLPFLEYRSATLSGLYLSLYCAVLHCTVRGRDPPRL